MDGRLCREPDYDPAWWYPERGQDVTRPKAGCERCAVREECLQFALNIGEKNGIWGGLSERQRRKVRPPSTKRTDEAAHRADRIVELRSQGLTTDAIAAAVGLHPETVREKLRHGRDAA